MVLARRGHFGEAAADLHITQPALSQQIKKLERDVGVELVHRGGRGFALTAAGEYLARSAPDLLRAADELVVQVRDRAAGTRGEVRIAYTRSGADAGIAGCLRRFREAHPEVRVSSITGWTAWNLEMLRNDEVDLAFVRGRIVDPDLELLLCGAEELALIVRRDHPLATEAAVARERIRGEPVVFWNRSSGPEYYDEVVSAVWPDGDARIVAVEADAEQVLAEVAAGIGVSVLDRRRSERIKPSGVVVVPLEGAPSVSISLAIRRDNESPVVRGLVAWWRENA